MHTDNGRRDELIRKWREEDSNITQIEIGNRLGITRQRVQQIERRIGLGPRRKKGEYKTYTFNCKQCRKKKVVKLSGRIYCSRKCFFESRKVKRTAEEERVRREKRLERNRVRSKWYYHNVFKKRKDWRAIIRKRNSRK